MKIAFFCYPSAFQNPGGGEIQLLKTKEALQRKGLSVKFFDQWQDRLEQFDVLHIFGSVKDCLGLMQTAKGKKTKIALSTIFWSSFKRAFYESRDLKTISNLSLRHFTKLILPCFPSSRRKMMLLADILLPNSEAELRQLRKLFAVPKKKIKVIPNGVDEKFKSANSELFIKKFGFRDFVLAAGRIEPRKNQLNLIKAFSRIDKELVVIGEPVSDYMDYYKKCKEAAGNKVSFLGGIKHEDPLLASAYAACSVFVAPGWFETPSLAALEAGLSGARLAVTKYGCTREYFGSFAQYFDPSSVKDIRIAIEEASQAKDKSALQQHILHNYTWDKVADATISAYERLLG